MPRIAFLAVSFLIALPCFGAESDALAIDAALQARHLPFGTVLDPIFAASDSDRITGYTRCGDSAIWTGHYLAAEAFRYKVTGSSDALDNVRAALAGIQLLVDVTGTDLLARCAVPVDSPYLPGIAQEEAHNGVYAGSINQQSYNWIGHTSRDEYVGVFFGLGVAHQMVNDAQVQASIESLATRMAAFLETNAWIAVMPDGAIGAEFLTRPDEQLALLQVARRVNSNRFSSAYKRLETEAPLAIAPVAVDVQDVHGSYFKFNLDYIGLYTLIGNESSFIPRLFYRAAYAVLRRATENHQNPHFNMIDRALTGANAGRDADTAAYLDQWLQRPRRDAYVDLTGTVASCSGGEACQPIPIGQRVPTDFLWQRDPFQLSGAGSGLIESAGIDYLLPYWMARYYGVIRE
ncbi:MAG: hypothetical protein ABI165_00665 [Bryobacteraceae bacterium]